MLLRELREIRQIQALPTVVGAAEAATKFREDYLWITLVTSGGVLGSIESQGNGWRSGV